MTGGIPTSREGFPSPTHTPPNSRSIRTPGYLLSPPSGGADPWGLVEPREGRDDRWLGLALGVVEVFPLSKGASHILEMVFIIVITEIRNTQDLQLIFAFIVLQLRVWGFL